MHDSSDSSDGDDISIYDSSSEEEEDSENSDEEKIPTRLQMSPDAAAAAADDDDDSEMYDEEEEEHKTPIPSFWFSTTEVRNWLELPPEIINMIFTKVGPIDILLRAQFVCTAWQNLSKQPHFYSSIDLRNRPDFYDEHNIRYNPGELVICAVNRSAGQLVEFSVEVIANDAMLKSITKMRSPLKCLRLVECDNIDEHDLMLMAKKLPLLEELEMLHCFCCKSMIRGFGRHCPKLKSFRLTCSYDRFCDKSNGQAFSIARNMPGLHHLDLFGNPLSDTGLIAILDQCMHLKSLDCRRCFRLTFGEDLLKRCADRNIDVKLPNDCCVGNYIVFGSIEEEEEESEKEEEESEEENELKKTRKNAKIKQSMLVLKKLGVACEVDVELKETQEEVKQLKRKVADLEKENELLKMEKERLKNNKAKTSTTYKKKEMNKEESLKEATTEEKEKSPAKRL